MKAFWASASELCLPNEAFSELKDPLFASYSIMGQSMYREINLVSILEAKKIKLELSDTDHKLLSR